MIVFNRTEEQLADSEKLRSELTDDLGDARAMQRLMHTELLELRHHNRNLMQQRAMWRERAETAETRLAQARNDNGMAQLRVERDGAMKRLAQVNGHNLLLQDTVDQLREHLRAYRNPDIEAGVRAEMRGDQSDPDLVAALAIVESEQEMAATLTEEPLLAFEGATVLTYRTAEAPAHLDHNREMAADAQASLDTDTE